MFFHFIYLSLIIYNCLSMFILLSESSSESHIYTSPTNIGVPFNCNIATAHLREEEVALLTSLRSSCGTGLIFKWF